MNKSNRAPTPDPISSSGSSSRHPDPQGPVPALSPPQRGRSPTRPSTSAVFRVLKKLRWTVGYRLEAFKRWSLRDCRLARIVSFIKRGGVPVQFRCPCCSDYVRHLIDRNWSADVLCCTPCRIGFTARESRLWRALTQRDHVIEEPTFIDRDEIRARLDEYAQAVARAEALHGNRGRGVKREVH